MFQFFSFHICVSFLGFDFELLPLIDKTGTAAVPAVPVFGLRCLGPQHGQLAGIGPADKEHSQDKPQQFHDGEGQPDQRCLSGQRQQPRAQQQEYRLTNGDDKAGGSLTQRLQEAERI